MKLLVVFSCLAALAVAEETKVVAAPLAYGYPYPAYGYSGYAGYAAPYTYAAAPVAVAPVVAPYNVGSQFHAQDEFGNLNYGYSNLNSAKQEAGNTYGGVTGGYSYVDAAGVLQQVRYVADGLGFRVADSRLPTFNPVLPVAPADTAEVAEAKAAFAAAFAAQEEAVAAVAERKKRSADPAFSYGFGTVHPYTYSGYPYSYGSLPYTGLPYAAGVPYYG